MLRDVLAFADLTAFALVGLVIFFLTFMGVIVWVFTRPAGRIEEWSLLPLQADADTRREKMP